MSNAVKLLDAIKKRICDESGKLFTTVQDYGGEFSAEEMNVKGFTAPAALIACLGWRPTRGGVMNGKRIWDLRIAVFVVTKNVKREERMRAAMIRAEWLAAIFAEWRPDDLCAGKPQDIAAENLYGRAIDKTGHALWMVSWWHQLQLPIERNPYDELASLEQIEINTVGQTKVGPTSEPTDSTHITHNLEMKDAES